MLYNFELYVYTDFEKCANPQEQEQSCHKIFDPNDPVAYKEKVRGQVRFDYYKSQKM